MSVKHPIVAVTGSSGSGTTTIKTTFQQIFRRENINAAIVEGDAFHRYDRAAMKIEIEKARHKGDLHLSHFGPENNLFAELETLFRTYGETGTGRIRTYLHDDAEAAPYGQRSAEFTPWEE